MFKKLRNITVIAVLTAFFCMPLAFAESFNLETTINKTEFYREEEVEITLKLKDFVDIDKGLNAYEGILEYDKDTFELVSQSSFTSLNKWMDFEYNFNTQNFIAYTKRRVTENEEILKLKLKVKNTALPKKSVIKIKDFVASEGKRDLFATSDVSINIVVPESSLPTTNPSTPQKPVNNKPVNNKPLNNTGSTIKTTVTTKKGATTKKGETTKKGTTTKKGSSTEKETTTRKVGTTTTTTTTASEKENKKDKKYHIVLWLLLLLLILILILIIIISKRRENDNGKINRISSILIVLLLILGFSNTALALGAKGDVNDDSKINDSDIIVLKRYLVELAQIRQESIQYADMNNDGYITVTDLSLLIEKVEARKDYKIDFSELSFETDYLEKNQQIFLDIYATVTENASIEEVKINGKDYPVTRMNGFYRVNIPGYSTYGLKNINLEAVKLDTEYIVETNRELQVEVLKDVPSIRDYNTQENPKNNQTIITFYIDDFENSFIGANVTVTDSGENEILVQEGTKGFNTIVIDTNEGEKYNVRITMTYDRDDNKIQTEENELSAIVQKEFTYNVDYEEKIENIELFKNVELSEVAPTFNKTDDIYLGFDFENKYDIPIESIVVNDKRYYPTVSELVDKMVFRLVNNFDIGNHQLNITEVKLENGKKLSVNKTANIKIIKVVPTVNITSVTEENDNLRIVLNILDDDNATTRNVINILDENDQILKTVELNKNQVEIVDLPITEDIMSSVYKIKVLSTYSIDEQPAEERIIKEYEQDAKHRLNIISSTTNKTIVDKRENVSITYKIKSNYGDITKLVVDNIEMNVTKQEDDNYTININTQSQAGEYNYNLTNVFVGREKTIVDYNTLIYVKKSIPTIELSKITDIYQSENDTYKSLFEVNVSDIDDAFTTGRIELFDSEDTNFENVLSAAVITSAGENELLLDIIENKKYVVKVSVDYDVDVREASLREDIYKGTVTNSYRHELITRENLVITNNTFRDQSFNAKTNFEKNEEILYSFNATYESEFEIASVIISNQRYDVQKRNDTYYVELPRLNSAKKYTYSIEKIILESTKEISVQKELGNVVSNTLQILKSEPTVTNFSYLEGETNNVTISYDLNDSDRAIESTILELRDENGTMVLSKENVDLGTNTFEIQLEDSMSYFITLKATYNRDIDNSNEYRVENKQLLLQEIDLGERKFEIKDVGNINIYQKVGQNIELIEAVDVEDLRTNYARTYLAEVTTKDMENFYTTIESVSTKNDILTLVLKYDNLTHYYNDDKVSELKIDYGSISNGYAYNSSVETILRRMILEPSSTIVLTNDIDASNYKTGNSIFPNGFTGTLDGNGHTIYNLTRPLFNEIRGATVKNLIIEDANISGNTGVVSTFMYSSTVTNVHIKNPKMNVTADRAGIFTGNLNDNSLIEKSTATGIYMTGGRTRSGGIVGTMTSSRVDNCYVEGVMATTGGYAYGGVAGCAEGKAYITNTIVDVSMQTGTNSPGGVVGVTYGQSVVLQNVLSLADGETGYRVNAGTLNNQSNNYYSLSISGLEFRENTREQEINPEDIDDEFFLNDLGLDPDIWDIVGKSYSNLPTLKNLDLRSTVAKENPKNPLVYIPDYQVISKLKNYDNKKEILYNNLYKIMPFFDTKYLVIDGAKLPKEHILNQNFIKGIIPYNNDRAIIGLTKNNQDSINKVKIIFEDNSTVTYNATSKDKIRTDQIATYELDVDGVRIGYTYSKYLVDSSSSYYREILNQVINSDYINDLDPLTEEVEKRNYFKNYPKAKQNAEAFVTNLLANNATLNYINDFGLIKELVNNKVFNDDELKKLLYTYNYFDRFYDIDINGINLRDITFFDGRMYDKQMNAINLTNSLLTADSSTRSTKNIISFYNNFVMKYNNLSLPDYIEEMVNIFTEYGEDTNSWFKEFFDGTVYEYGTRDYSANPDDPDNFLEYRAWQRLRKTQNGKFILPMLTYHDDDLYLASFPTQITIGNLRYYFRGREWDSVTDQEIKDLMDPFFESVALLYNTLGGIYHGTQTFDHMNARADVGHDTTGNKPDSEMEGVEGIDPVYEYIYESIFDRWPYHSSAGAYANTAWGIYYCWYSGIDRNNRVTWSHENAHNQDGAVFLGGVGTRVPTVNEMSTDGFITQNWGAYDIVPNYMFNYDITRDLATNLTAERLNTREKFENYYGRMFETYNMLSYLEGKAFLKLNHREQSKIGSQVVEEEYGSFNRITEEIQPDEAQYAEWDLQTLEDLWDKKIIAARGPGARSMAGGSAFVGGSPWYVTHFNEGLAESGYRQLTYEMLGEFGIGAYQSYGGGAYYDYETKSPLRQGNGYKKGANDLVLMQAFLNYEGSDPWKEYQKRKYADIERKVNKVSNSYQDIEPAMKKAMELDVKYDLGTSQNGLEFILRKFLYGYLKRATNDFETSIFDDDAFTKRSVTVRSAQDMLAYANEEAFNVNFVLEDDIDFSNVQTDGDTYLKNFAGTINGKGHAIKGLRKPLFNYMLYSNVYDVEFKDINIETESATIGALSKTMFSSVVKDVKLTNVNISAGKGSGDQSNTAAITGQGQYMILVNIKADGLNISGSGHDVAGIIARFFNSYASNIHVSNSTVTGSSRTGGLFAYALEVPEVNKSSFSGNVNARSNESGGLIGQMGNVNIKDCYTLGRISGNNNNGGLVGAVNTSDRKTLSRIQSSYSNMEVSGNNNNGGFIGWGANEVVITNSMALGKVRGGFKFDGRSEQTVINNYSNNFELEESLGKSTEDRGLDITGKITSRKLKDINESFFINTLHWSNTTWNFEDVSRGGLPKLNSTLDTNSTSSIVDRTEISNADEFMQRISESPGNYFVLTKDIDFSEVTGTNYAIYDGFTGTIDGDNHVMKNLNGASLFYQFNGTIKNVTIRDFANEKDTNTDNVAAFATQTNGASFTNVKFENVRVTGRHRVAVITGLDQSNSTFNRVSVTNAYVSGSGVYVSAFVGRKYGGIVRDCLIEGEVYGNSTEIAGVIGASHNNGTYENIVANVRFTLTGNTDGQNRNNNGGVVGNIYNSPRFKNSISVGNMTGALVNNEMKTPYKFSGANESNNVAYLENCYEVSDRTGTTSITPNTTNALKEVTSNEIKNPNFYKENLGFNESIWDFSTVSSLGYPKLR